MPKKKARTDVSLSIRLQPAEFDAVLADIAELTSATGIPISHGAYCKHATRSFARYRRALTQLRAAGLPPELEAIVKAVMP